MRRFLLGLGLLSVVVTLGCEKRPTQAGGKTVPHWVQALDDPDAKVRKEASFKLGNVGPKDPAVLPALLKALKDRDSRVRREAILALVKCGPAAKEALPTLAQMERHDADAQVRTYATKALGRLKDFDPD